ncbi:hypothetical protein N9L19_01120 [bacterium]|nr:hypothetical protein [bacterium]
MNQSDSDGGFLLLAALGRLEFSDVEPRDESSLPPVEIMPAEHAGGDPSCDASSPSVLCPSLGISF